MTSAVILHTIIHRTVVKIKIIWQQFKKKIKNYRCYIAIFDAWFLYYDEIRNALFVRSLV